VDLGANKGDILKALSKLVASSTGKPESYVGKSFQVFYHLQCISILISLVRHSQLKLHNNVAVCITDKASMVFGGSDDPLALGCVYSLGKSAGSLSLSVILTLKYKI
jgi:hypothetical protein